MAPDKEVTTEQEVARVADPVGDPIEALAGYLRAERWVIAIDTERGWITHGREASHKDDLLLHVAGALSSGEGTFLYETPELGHAGLRLQTSGVETLLVLATGTEGSSGGAPTETQRADGAVVVFFENPDRQTAEGFADSDLAPTLARMAAGIRGTHENVARVNELRALGGWLHSLGELSEGEIEEADALAHLGSLGMGTCLISVKLERDHLDAVWAVGKDGGWETGSSRLRNAAALKLDPPSAEQLATIAKLLGLPSGGEWLIGRAGAGAFLAVSGAPTGTESVDALASLFEAAAGRGRDTTATRNNAMLTERARIAGVIHEGITQVLTNVAIQMEVLDQVMEDPEAARKMVRAMRSAVLEALDSLRGAILELTPNAPEWTDLAKGLERFVGDFGAQWGLELSYEIEGETRDVDPDVLALVFALVQEGLSNVRKHAGTPEASVTVSFDDGRIRVAVADQGKGFDPAASADEGFRQHQGIQIMRSRVRLAGGRLELQSTPGHGTTMLLEVVA